MSPLQDLRSVIALVKILKKNQIDIVIGHTPKGGLIAMLAGKLAGIKTRIYFRHGLLHETAIGFKYFLLKRIEKLTGFLATKVVCVGQEIKRKSDEQQLSAVNKNIIFERGTANGIDCFGKFNPFNVNSSRLAQLKSQWQISSHHFVLGYVGRLVRDKGINELVNAWSSVTKLRPHAKLLLVGPLEERDAVEEVTKQKILSEPSIIYTGLVNGVSAFYALMDAFILPSYREGFPTVVLEASSMELPVLTTQVTGCAESIIVGVTGDFISLQEDSLVGAIVSYIDNPTALRAKGQNGRKFVVENFEQTHIWDSIEQKILHS